MELAEVGRPLLLSFVWIIVDGEPGVGLSQSSQGCSQHIIKRILATVRGTIEKALQKVAASL